MQDPVVATFGKARLAALVCSLDNTSGAVGRSGIANAQADVRVEMSVVTALKLGPWQDISYRI
jgi:hypothetical protein